MKTVLCWTLMAWFALSATAQNVPEAPPLPAGASPEEEAAYRRAVAAIRIRSSDLMRRAQTTTNTLVVANAPESPVAAAAVTPPVGPSPPVAGAAEVRQPPPPSFNAGPPPPPLNGQTPGQLPPPPPPPPGAKTDLAAGTSPVPTQKPTFDVGTIGPNDPIEFDWMNADITQVLAKYSELTRRSAVMQQGLQGLVTFRSSGPLTLEEAIGALESVLLMNGFAIIPMGEKFFKVVPSTTGTMEGVPVAKETATVPQFDRVIAQIVRVKFLDVTDVARALGGSGGAGGGPMPAMPQGAATGMGRVFLHPYGQMIPMPRSNAILLIDTALNVSRLKEIIEYMDTTSETKMETRMYVLENADGASVYKILQQLVAADQGSTSASGAAMLGMPGMPGQPAMFSGTGSGRRIATSIEESVLLGRVLMGYDDRTNAIILITQEMNFAFFERIIKALDVRTNQDFKTRVFFLNYADAIEMSDMLYRFVQGSSPSSVGTANRSSTAGRTTGTTGGRTTGTSSRSTSGTSSGSRSRTSAAGTSSTRSGSRSTAASRRSTTPTTTPTQPGMPTPTSAAAAQAQQLTEIIPDQRNNAVVVFAPEADLQMIGDIIKQLDVFPPQLHIDVVVAEVSLDKDTIFGVDLFQRVLGRNTKAAGVSSPDGGALQATKTIGNSSSTNSSSNISRLIDPSLLIAPTALPSGLSGGLTYFFSFFGNDLYAVVRALSGDDHFKVLQTPHLYTSNNQRARIFVGESRPFVTSTQTTINSDQSRSNYENIDIGVGLEITPLINPDGVVTLDIFQTVDDVKSTTKIDNNDVPILSRREAEAVAVTVKDGQIIVLGGLNSVKREQVVSKVPILGDIPLLGNVFKTTEWKDQKTELVFFLRPKVIRTIEEAQRYTWGRIEQSKELRTMPIRDVEGYSPLLDKRYSNKLKALDRFDKSDKF